MHMCNGILSVCRGVVENVGDAAIGHELLIHGHLELTDGAVEGEDFVEVRGLDVFGELFDDDFGGAWAGGAA